MKRGLVSRSEDYSAWYLDVVKRADLACASSVRGCMVIKPYGFAIWERMQALLDSMFKKTGHVNAYFPLLIPQSHLTKEASHVEGFAKECAVVTHHRLKQEGNQIVVDEKAKLSEPLVIRPTSETSIWSTYRDWITSYRDLPLLVNQWANVLRWEMRTRPFLRTTEFLWQEGHTAHATKKEAQQEAQRMLQVYTDFAQKELAIPVSQGTKTASERFAGAEETYCIEALMQDGKALQMGTSHFLGQNFAKAFDVRFATETGGLDYVWGSSWGVSTRLMGALIMVHSDDKGLVLPPNLAPHQVVIVPIYYNAAEQKALLKTAARLQKRWQTKGVRVHIDDRETHKPGWKFAEYEMRGVPIRIALGPKDLNDNTLELFRRDTLNKTTMPQESFDPVSLLSEIQQHMFEKASTFSSENTVRLDNYDEFKKRLEQQGGFILAHWDGTAKTEARIKEETQATIRCIPVAQPKESGKCILSGKPSSRRVLFARAY